MKRRWYDGMKRIRVDMIPEISLSLERLSTALQAGIMEFTDEMEGLDIGSDEYEQAEEVLDRLDDANIELGDIRDRLESVRDWIADADEKTRGKAIPQKEGIKIDGHVGSWYVVDEDVLDGRGIYLLEHEQYGDMAAGLIVDAELNVLADDVWNGFDDLDEWGFEKYSVVDERSGRSGNEVL